MSKRKRLKDSDNFNLKPLSSKRVKVKVRKVVTPKFEFTPDAALFEETVESFKTLCDLVRQLEIVMNSREYVGMWGLAWAHGGRYTGPTWKKECDAAKALLDKHGYKWDVKKDSEE